jgi:hypothetical protein
VSFDASIAVVWRVALGTYDGEASRIERSVQLGRDRAHASPVMPARQSNFSIVLRASGENTRRGYRRIATP